MGYPTHLLDEVKKNSKEFQLEGFLSGNGSPQAKAMLVGEAPGQTELVTKLPFTGQAGKELDNELEQAGLSREDLYITSVVRSRPFKIKKRVNKDGTVSESRPNRTPTKAEVLAHAPLIDYDIQHIKPKIIAPMGNIALKRLLGSPYTISAYHGQVLNDSIFQLSDDRSTYVKSTERYIIFPLYHPAAVLYNRSLADVISKDWRALFELISELS